MLYLIYSVPDLDEKDSRKHVYIVGGFFNVSFWEDKEDDIYS